ncbi:SPOR domain-containing protein [Sphingomonas sp. RS6]
MGIGADGRYDSDERLPWLETVEDAYEEPRRGRVFLLVFAGLILLGAVAALLVWHRTQGGQGGNGELIPAPPGDYKIKPEEPGGMRVDGEGDTVFRTSQGAASNASINVAALPEAPVEGRIAPKPAKAPTQPTNRATIPLPKAEPIATLSRATKAPDGPSLGAGSGSLVQLGAFPSEGAANIAWVRLAKRFAYLEPFGKSVERYVDPAGKTFYRLRVNTGSNGQAREICGRLKVAGERCFVAS